MDELNEEIKLTLNLMQTDIDDGAHDELQGHLYSLLEMKRRRLEGCKIEYVAQDPTPYKSGKIDLQFGDPDKPLTADEWMAGLAFVKDSDEAKPLTAEELKDGGWWLDGAVSQSLLELFREYGVNITGVSSGWFDASVGVTCVISSRDFGSDLSEFKQIHKIGNEFYWYEK